MWRGGQVQILVVAATQYDDASNAKEKTKQYQHLSHSVDNYLSNQTMYLLDQ